MSKQVKTFLIFWGVWFIASLLNGFLSGLCISLFCSGAWGNGSFGLALVFSFIFSAPLVGVVWLVASMAIANGKKADALFQTILGTALLLGFLGAVFFLSVFGNEFNQASYGVAFSIAISALTAVLFFRKQLKTDE